MYRCGDWKCGCRKRYSVTHGSPLFRDLGGGAYSLTYQVLAFHGWCEDKSLTQIARDLDVYPSDVQRWIEKALMIVEADMLAKRLLMVFGGRGTSTTDVEADETCLQS